MQVCINAIAVVPAEYSGSEDWLGLALYPRAAILNHACRPTVSASFKGVQLRLHAVGDIPPEAPLRLCYGPQVPQNLRLLCLKTSFECFLNCTLRLLLLRKA
jgi:hypothetical protein